MSSPDPDLIYINDDLVEGFSLVDDEGNLIYHVTYRHSFSPGRMALLQAADDIIEQRRQRDGYEG